MGSKPYDTRGSLIWRVRLYVASTCDGPWASLSLSLGVSRAVLRRDGSGVCVWELVDPTVFNSPGLQTLTLIRSMTGRPELRRFSGAFERLRSERTERVGEIGWLEGTRACERGEAVGSV